jgi:hypothetical protein
VSSRLKVSKSGASAAFAGREFHSLTVAGKKLCFSVSVFVYCCLNVFLFPALVQPLLRVKYVSTGMSIKSCVILYIVTSFNVSRLLSRVSQPRWSSMEVTLLVLWYLLVVNLAALRCTISIRSIWSFFVWTPSCGTELYNWSHHCVIRGCLRSLILDLEVPS